MADRENPRPGRWRLPAAMAGCFILGLAVMYAVGGFGGRDRAAPEVPDTVVTVPVRDDDVAQFLGAVEAGDYGAMRDIGGRTFRKGVIITNHAERFGDYATNSLPPYAVYAFYIDLNVASGRRVMLTVDADGVVDSFMAEEMKIVE
ncbi:MAG: hypothetical protein LIQ31_04695 [Planctomycetes bacterium]|nr:hypothetical protein [Planctomycetota bacterium]